MERLDNRTLTFFEIVALVIFILIQSGCAQKGFTSLECCGESNYTDTNTNISWQSDDSWFPNRSNCRSGTIINTAENSTANYSLRVFESKIAKKWCYNLTTTPNQTYLIRGTFSFADQGSPASSFNVSIGVTPISQVKSSENAEVEKIFKATRNYVDYCLVEGNGDASISKLELRPVVDLKYTNKEPNSVLKLIARVDLGNKGVPIRYPDDASDRIWKAPSIPIPNYTPLPSSSPNASSPADPVAPPVPLPVLQTALQHYDRLDFNHSNLDAGPQNYLVYLHFFELNSTVRIGERVFDIFINSHKLLDGVDVLTDGNTYKPYVVNVSASGSLNLSLVKVVNGSRFGPILNAYEIFQVVSAVQESNQDTVDVIVEVKNELLVGNPSSELLEGWTGDPCLPVEWRGVTCQLFNGSDVITGLDLSLQKLNGFLPASVTQLTYLTRLNVSNNGFTGSIPEFPANSILTSVDLSYNNLTGKISPPLSSLPHLTSLYFGCNPHLSKELPVGFNINRRFTSDYGKCGRSSPRVREIIIGTAICGSVLLGVIIVMIFLCCRRHKLSAPLGFEGQAYTTKSAVFALPSMDEFLITTISVQSFTLDYIENVTQMYQTLIGEGGFGSVYRGTLSDGEEVAVKVRSATSTQGTREFENELNLLSDIRHENLVPLLGYCWENEQRILVYPYMSNGSLQDRLYGQAAKRKTLDWATRLSIALGAARGITYLHTYAGGCVIHRDVKSSNILLDHSMCAKVADFGFSKYAPQEGDSGVSLEVRGTAGYLDPEYYSTQHLSAKSDVFSFGVVLLEIVTGREPLNIQRPRSEWSLVEWAKPYIGNQKIEEIVDPNIKGGYHSEAMWRVVEAALACIEPYGAYRPSMADIVRELEDALIIENNASEYMRSIDSLGGSARYSLPTEKRILQLPIKSSIETSTASPQFVSLPQPR